MVNLQYIGARYVPIVFTNPDDGTSNWKSGIAYEALTIVTVNGNSYTSKKAVPDGIGSPQSNPDYWVKTGDFNASLIALQNRVGAVENTLGSGNIPAPFTDVLNMLGAVDPLVFPEYIVFIGDSYTGATSLGSDIDRRYSTQLSKKLKLTEKNYAVGGSGFTGGSRKYSLQIDDAISDFRTNSLDVNKVKYFVIGGTRNDKDTITYSTYNTEIRDCLYKIHGNFPNAEIIILGLLYDYHFMPNYYLRNAAWLQSICAQYNDEIGIRYIDCHNWLTGSMNDVLYQNGANVHPTVSGHSLIANHAYSAIKGGENYQPDSMAYPVRNGFPNVGIYRNGCDIMITRTKGYIRFFLRVQFTDVTQFSAGDNIYTYTWPSSQAQPFYIGDQSFNVPLGDGIASVTFSSNKTGDTSGDCTLTIALTTVPTVNKTYEYNMTFADGVLLDVNAS